MEYPYYFSIVYFEAIDGERHIVFASDIMKKSGSNDGMHINIDPGGSIKFSSKFAAQNLVLKVINLETNKYPNWVAEALTKDVDIKKVLDNN